LDEFESVEKKEAANLKSAKEEANKKESEEEAKNSPPEALLDEVTKLIEGLSTGTFDKSLEDILAQTKMDFEGLDMANLTEESLEKLVEEFESKPEMQEVMEEMMTQLMSKEVMYEPMKKMQEKVGLKIQYYVRGLMGFLVS
jgi:hypothetical protein